MYIKQIRIFHHLEALVVSRVNRSLSSKGTIFPKFFSNTSQIIDFRVLVQRDRRTRPIIINRDVVERLEVVLERNRVLTTSKRIKKELTKVGENEDQQQQRENRRMEKGECTRGRCTELVPRRPSLLRLN